MPYFTQTIEFFTLCQCFIFAGQIFLAPPSIALRSRDPKTSRTSFLRQRHFTSPTSGRTAMKRMLFCVLLVHYSEHLSFVRPFLRSLRVCLLRVQGRSWRGWPASSVFKQWRNRQGLQVLPVRNTFHGWTNTSSLYWDTFSYKCRSLLLWIGGHYVTPTRSPRSRVFWSPSEMFSSVSALSSPGTVRWPWSRCHQWKKQSRLWWTFTTMTWEGITILKFPFQSPQSNTCTQPRR